MSYTTSFYSETYDCLLFDCNRRNHTAWLLSLLLQATFVLLVLSRWIAPFILRQVLRRVRVRSISLRSIKGLYVRTGRITLKIERIGLSYHQRSEVHPRRFSIKVEGLRLEVHSQFDHSPERKASPNIVYHAFFSAISFISKLDLINALYLSVSWWIRPILRLFFVTMGRILIRSLPALTQILDFEMDSATVSFAALEGAHICISGFHAGTKIEFTQLESVISTSYSLSQPGVRLPWAVNWGSRFKASLKRTWDRVWGETEGLASISIKVNRITSFSSAGTPLNNLRGAEGFYCGEFPLHPSLVIDVGDPASLELSVRFSPGKRQIHKKSICVSTKLFNVNARIHSIMALWQKYNTTSRNINVDEVIASAPLMDRLKTAVMANTFRRSSKASVSLSLQPHHVLLWFSVVDRIDVELGHLTILHEDVGDSSHEKPICIYRLACESSCLSVRGGVGNNHELYTQWLGTPETLSADHEKLDVSSGYLRLNGFRCHILYKDESYINTPPVLQLKTLDISSVVRHWSFLDLAIPSSILGDPNVCLVIGRVTVEEVEVGIIMDRILEIFKPFFSRRSSSSFLSSKVIQIPPLHFDVHLNKYTCRIWASSFHTDAGSFLAMRSDGFHLGAHLLYTTDWESCTRTSISGNVKKCRLMAEATLQFLIYPLFVRIPSTVRTAFERTLLWRQLDEDWLSEAEPCLCIASIDGAVNGTAISSLEDHHIPLVDLKSCMVDARLVTDDIAVEVWNQESLSFLVLILKSFVAAMDAGYIPPADTSSQDMSPFCVSIFLGVSNLTIFITGVDLNPNGGLNISRGVYLKTSFNCQICQLRSRAQGELVGTRRMMEARGRQKMGLPDDLLMETIALLSYGNHNGKLVSFKIGTRQTLVRRATAMAHIPDVTHIDAWEKGFYDENLNSLIMDIPFMEFRIRTGENSDISPESLRTQWSFDIRQIILQFNMLTGYSSLLALDTLRTISRPWFDRRQGKGSSAELTRSLTIQLGTLHLACTLPLKERLFVDCRSVTVRCGRISNSVTSRELAVYVPSVVAPGKWEHIVRAKGIHLVLDQSTIHLSQPYFTRVSVDGLSIHVPWKYVFADLILDLNVSFKVLRHLFRSTSLRKFMPMMTPGPEGPKHVPNLYLTVASLCLEMSDDPLEARLGLLWRAGFVAQRTRLERDYAFDAKSAVIDKSSSPQFKSPAVSEQFSFSPTHTVSVEEARHRLYAVHSASWLLAIREAKESQRRQEGAISQYVWGDKHNPLGPERDLPIQLHPVPTAPPLLRIALSQFSVHISKPSFDRDHLLDFLTHVGGAVPDSTSFSLCVPSHVEIEAATVNVSIRDYPLPVANIHPSSDLRSSSLSLKGDVVLAEELGPSESTQWVQCIVSEEDADIPGAPLFKIQVPKTLMPVKIYAPLEVNVNTSSIVDLAWGVSYMPAIQSIAKSLESLVHPPQDPSPTLGFWDKMRLICHTRVKVLFSNEVHLHLKGSKDPYELTGEGAGFALCWRGYPELFVEPNNDEHELVHIISDSMLVVIPNLTSYINTPILGSGKLHTSTPTILNDKHDSFSQVYPSRFRKIVANFTNGIRMGLGFIFERACRDKCGACGNEAHAQTCRIFTFEPHYHVKLRTSSAQGSDSYAGFRSDFIHFSMSLISPVKRHEQPTQHPSSVHLSGLTFAHFWQWWSLFDSSMSLPIGQGRLYPDARPPSPKFSKHLGTLKYRIAVSNLFISHVYVQDTVESWDCGETRMVGIKVQMSEFRADMHQREQEITYSSSPGSPKARRKAFNAAEVSIHDISLGAMFAIFSEPDKLSVRLPKEPTPGLNKAWDNVPLLDSQSTWASRDDWVELDWNPESEPQLYLADVARCPRFIYFKTLPSENAVSNISAVNGKKEGNSVTSRFTGEDTHICLMGSEPSIHEVQVALAKERLRDLSADLKGFDNVPQENESLSGLSSSVETLEKQIKHLKSYIESLQLAGGLKSHQREPNVNFHSIPSEAVLPNDWQHFANVYHVHSPLINLSNATRNMMMQYYYASRARRGFEYHMATRAVKFLQDQAQTLFPEQQELDSSKRAWNPSTSAQAAAQVIRRILIRDDRRTDQDETGPPNSAPLHKVDPALGWASKDISIRRGHFCLLLKPQIVLQSEHAARCEIVLASSDASLQSFTILDNLNADDPVNGYIMTRTYAALNGLQAFAPARDRIWRPLQHRSVPLEVLVDYQYSSIDFDRLVPPTDASLQYDKFNRLRLRNKVSSVGQNEAEEEQNMVEHLQHHMDLIAVNIPRIAVSADSRHFSSISHVVTDLLLYSDPVYQRRAEELETFLISYDFHDLKEAAKVVLDYQTRIRFLQTSIREMEVRPQYELQRLLVNSFTELRAQLFMASEELNIIFEAIKLAQEKSHDQKMDQKMAFRLLATSSEISWQMIDDGSELLAKLAVKDVLFSWLSRQDSSTVNKLTIRDLHAFDGSPNAVWPELLSRYKEPASHSLVKRGIFAEADWCILPPVGGISIYELFKMELHPIRLQIQTSLGTRILEYVWPARRTRGSIATDTAFHATEAEHITFSEPEPGAPVLPTNKFNPAIVSDSLRLRSLGETKSFTDLHDSLDVKTPILKRAQSFTALFPEQLITTANSTEIPTPRLNPDAMTMRTRSSQKTFVLVQIASMHLLLSIMKEDSFLCRDARIKTRELVYHNKTWSFEELADQFIPSDLSWRGWVRMALQQPLLPVLPVARELISKTKWGGITPNGLNSDATSSDYVDRQGTNPFDQHREKSSRSKLPWRSRQHPAKSSKPSKAKDVTIRNDNIADQTTDRLDSKRRSQEEEKEID